MSDQPPPPKTKDNADPPIIPPTKPDEPGFSIKLIDNLEEGETKDGIKAILASNALLTEKITKMETERAHDKYEKERQEKLTVLKEIDQRSFDKYKDEKDTGRLDQAISDAKDFKLNFPKYQADKDKKDPQKVLTHRNPRTGKME